MPRPMKRRRICSTPLMDEFGPLKNNGKNVIFLNLEEYETIRLIDYENLNQEECASFMNVARTTVQRIYESARKKIADSLVNGKTIKISGGNYTLCDQNIQERKCGRINCPRSDKL